MGTVLHDRSSICTFIENDFLVILSVCMVNVLKFLTLVACLKDLDKQSRQNGFFRSSLIRVFPVCYSDKHLVNSSPDNQQFILKQKEKSVGNVRTFAVSSKNL